MRKSITLRQEPQDMAGFEFAVVFGILLPIGSGSYLCIIPNSSFL